MPGRRIGSFYSLGALLLPVFLIVTGAVGPAGYAALHHQQVSLSVHPHHLQPLGWSPCGSPCVRPFSVPLNTLPGVVPPPMEAGARALGPIVRAFAGRRRNRAVFIVPAKPLYPWTCRSRPRSRRVRRCPPKPADLLRTRPKRRRRPLPGAVARFGYRFRWPASGLFGPPDSSEPQLDRLVTVRSPLVRICVTAHGPASIISNGHDLPGVVEHLGHADLSYRETPSAFSLPVIGCFCPPATGAILATLDETAAEAFSACRQPEQCNFTTGSSILFKPDCPV